MEVLIFRETDSKTVYAPYLSETPTHIYQTYTEQQHHTATISINVERLIHTSIRHLFHAPYWIPCFWLLTCNLCCRTLSSQLNRTMDARRCSILVVTDAEHSDDSFSLLHTVFSYGKYTTNTDTLVSILSLMPTFRFWLSDFKWPLSRPILISLVYCNLVFTTRRTSLLLWCF